MNDTKEVADSLNILKQFATPERIERFESILGQRTSSTIVLLENVNNEMNRLIVSTW